MPRNVYFSQAVKSEQNLYEDLIIESLGIYGQDVYYIPRTIVNRDSILNEDPASTFDDAFLMEMYIENAKLNPETRDFVEIAIKLPTNVLLPIDSHWPKERFKDVIEAFNSNDKEKLKNSRKLLADALRKKAEDVKEKYINPPKSTPFAFVYVPIESIYNELINYTDPKTKIDLAQELRKDFQITIVGPNTLFQSIQAFNIGFATLKVQKYALQIYDDLKYLGYKACDIPTNIKIFPACNDMNSIYKHVKIVFLLSIWHESGSRVIQESYSNGIPVICFNAGGNKEFI